MAEVAADVRDEVLAMYEIETPTGPSASFTASSAQLISDLTPEGFADVYAQTMVYGLLTARITHPERFTEDASLAALDFENPFLDAIYARFRQQSDDVLDIDELGLSELAEELAATDVDQVLADFGTRRPSRRPGRALLRGLPDGIRPRAADRLGRLLHATAGRRAHRDDRRSSS